MENFFAHPSAFVDEGAQIGKGTKIWHFTHIMPGATIGKDCVIGQNVFIADKVAVGNSVKIQNNVSLYEGVTLEDGVFCGPSMVFTNVLRPRSPYPRDRETGFHKTRVGKGATLGANSTIICGVTLGSWSFVGAGAVVTKDVPDHGLVTGVPAKLIGWVCECGEALKIVKNKSTCSACKRRYTKGKTGLKIL